MLSDSLLVLSHSYAHFVKNTVEPMASDFRSIDVLVRVNPVAEISRVLPIHYLKVFNIASKINLSGVPSNVHVTPLPILYLPFNFWFHILGEQHFRKAEAYLRKNRSSYNLLHAHFLYTAGYAAARLKERYHVPFIATAHGYDIYDLPFRNPHLRRKIEYVLNMADHVIAVSRSNLSAIQKLDVTTETTVIPNGFDPSVFHPMEMAECRKRLGVPSDRKILVTVANLYDEVKGHRYLVEAMHHLVHDRGRRDLVCYIIGEGRLRQEIQRQIHALGLDGRVILVGARAHGEIPYWINAGDIFVLPSLAEGNPVVLVEALGCGKPFVGTRVGGVPEIITSPEYGLLVEPGNARELAQAIDLALDREWDHQRIARDALQYSWDRIVDEIRGVYRTVLRS